MDETKKISLFYTTLNVPLPDFIYDGIREFSKNANSYQPQPSKLVDSLAERHNVSRDRIFITAGADEAIQLLAMAYGKSTYYYTPTYIGYQDTENIGATVHPINAMHDGEYAINTARIDDASLIYLANPNNPFGFTPRDKVVDLVKNNPQAIVVSDEVYDSFAPELSVLGELSEYPNLVILRSFSKGFGMAGNRIGYMIASPHIVEQIRLKSPLSSTSYLSVGAALAALDHEQYFKDAIDEIKRTRETFTAFLKSKGRAVLPGLINAVLIKFPDENSAAKFLQHLNDNNFIVRQGGSGRNAGLDDTFVRITIGTPDEMRMATEVIERYE
ncbi:MAG TPA: aminotransferase class I/II-fold pyridoxal phosphate-dependent enzyme [Candidatus Saccharimonadales bacterium]|nr:aminotransferase class I/II-fold pyridoxal phosphate-dependent enzyme [Candidatus Saccharimonadales bacterium]